MVWVWELLADISLRGSISVADLLYLQSVRELDKESARHILPDWPPAGDDGGHTSLYQRRSRPRPLINVSRAVVQPRAGCKDKNLGPRQFYLGKIDGENLAASEKKCGDGRVRSGKAVT